MKILTIAAVCIFTVLSLITFASQGVASLAGFILWMGGFASSELISYACGRADQKRNGFAEQSSDGHVTV